MNFAVIGSGGREHAICYKLKQSPQIKKLICIPGNAGTKKVANNIKMTVVDAKTGIKADFGSNKTIIESFKKEKFENEINVGIDGLIYKISKNNILEFY